VTDRVKANKSIIIYHLSIKVCAEGELTDLKALLLVNVSDLYELKLSLGDQGKTKYGLELLKAENSDLYNTRRPSSLKILLTELAKPMLVSHSNKRDLNIFQQGHSVEEVIALLENQRLSLL
jgi:hypothetical protein